MQFTALLLLHLSYVQKSLSVPALNTLGLCSKVSRDGPWTRAAQKQEQVCTDFNLQDRVGRVFVLKVQQTCYGSDKYGSDIHLQISFHAVRLHQTYTSKPAFFNWRLDKKRHLMQLENNSIVLWDLMPSWWSRLTMWVNTDTRSVGSCHNGVGSRQETAIRHGG